MVHGEVVTDENDQTIRIHNTRYLRGPHTAVKFSPRGGASTGLDGEGRISHSQPRTGKFTKVVEQATGKNRSCRNGSRACLRFQEAVH